MPRMTKAELGLAKAQLRVRIRELCAMSCEELQAEAQKDHPTLILQQGPTETSEHFRGELLRFLLMDELDKAVPDHYIW